VFNKVQHQRCSCH